MVRTGWCLQHRLRWKGIENATEKNSQKNNNVRFNTIFTARQKWQFLTLSFLIFGILSFQLKSCQISFHRFFPWVPWTPFFPFPQTSSPRLQVFGNWCLDGWHDQTNINSYVITYPRSWYQHSFFLWNHHPRQQNVLPRISYWWYDALPYAASNFRQQ